MLYEGFPQPPRLLRMFDRCMLVAQRGEDTPRGRREKIGPRLIFPPHDGIVSPFCFTALASPTALSLQPRDVNNQPQINIAAKASAVGRVSAIANYLRGTSKLTALTRTRSSRAAEYATTAVSAHVISGGVSSEIMLVKV